jgi:hypothetical protein
MRSLLLTRIGLYAAFVILLPACASVFSPTPTQTPMPATSTPQPTAAKPKEYVVPAGVFPLDTKKSCRTDAAITDVDASGFMASGTISMIDGAFALWCPGAQHAWEGTLSHEGYTFSSDSFRPLRFQVDSDGSYRYVGGAGTVIDPNGAEIVLP